MVWAGFAVSAVLLTVIQAPIDLGWLAWVSLVPFVLVCRPEEKSFRLAIAAYIVSLFYWLGNLYWIFPVTWAGWFCFCGYTALLWPILALCVRYCRGKGVPLFLAVPVLFVGAERLQGLFLGGFFWRFLGHSQYANVTIIQIADIFGAAGVSFVVGMVNGLVGELILDARCSVLDTRCLMLGARCSGPDARGSVLDIRGWRNIFKISNFLKTAVVCGALVGTIVYGRWRIAQSEEVVEEGPLVGSVQSNIPQSVKQTFEASDVIFEEVLKESRACARGGAELIVWPETMVQAVLNQEVLPFLASPETKELYDKVIREHAKDTAYVLAGGYRAELRRQGGLTGSLARYNSAFLYRPDGEQSDKVYSKIHLVPFGEFVPFRKSFPPLYNLLMLFTPYDYDYSLDAGTEYTVFEMASNEEEDSRIYRFSVMICYEDAVPVIARRFAKSGQGGKHLDWLVNISNDGWFVQQKDGEIIPSTELAQHAAICVFRAVENRLAVVRSVNTGISCLIDTVGRIRNGFEGGNLPHEAMVRTACAGWFVDRVPIDERTTFFNKYGQWLEFSCVVCLFLVIILPPAAGFIRNKKYAVFERRQQNEEQA